MGASSTVQSAGIYRARVSHKAGEDGEEIMAASAHNAGHEARLSRVIENKVATSYIP